MALTSNQDQEHSRGHGWNTLHPITYCLLFESTQDQGSLTFWHQGPVSWKTIFRRRVSTTRWPVLFHCSLNLYPDALQGTFQEGDEGRGPFDFFPSPYPFQGRSGLRWFIRLSVIWKEKPGWASSGFSRPGSPPREGKVCIVQRGNLTQIGRAHV